jgi:hypothetical protein
MGGKNMANISPGVYTKIIDLSTFVQAVPSTIGFICALTEKGRDNELLFIGSRADLIAEFGEPDISKYGKNYGQGLYCAYNYLGESGSLYFLRCLSDNATYANIRIDAYETDTTADIQINYVGSLNSKNEIKTRLSDATPRHPICFLYPIGRGEYYNALGVRITEHSNPLLDGVYVLDIYQKQTDGNDEIIESFEVSFDPMAIDTAGESLWIESILETYSTVLRAEMLLNSGAYSAGDDYIAKVYDKNIGNITMTSGGTITDNKQDFSQWEDSGGVGQYIILAIDDKGQKVWAWGGASSGANNETITVYTDRTLAIQGWNTIGTGTFNYSSDDISYFVKKSYGNIATAFISSTPVPLKLGTDGDLLNDDGSLDTSEATDILANGYAGQIDDNVLDTENIYFSIVFDCGYPGDVKDQIYNLCTTRRDCIGILDNGDNTSYTLAINARENDNTYNSYLVALYECYNKVFDTFTGQDVWFSPIYHMSYILPRNDTVGELWYAAAGYNRAAIGTIKELRFNPRLGQRDQMYLKQLNPIVKFNPGYVVWGQLTSQSKASALQDINIARLILYCKRALEQYCRNFIFEQNDSITWNLVKADIVDFLESIKKRRGLYDYAIDVGANDYEKKTKTFHVDVTLNPTRVVEKIELNFFIK